MRSGLKLTRPVNQAGHFHSPRCIAGAVKTDGCCLHLKTVKRIIRKSSTRCRAGKARRNVEAFRHFDMITSESSSVGGISPCRDWWRLRYGDPSPSPVLLVLSGIFDLPVIPVAQKSRSDADSWAGLQAGRGRLCVLRASSDVGCVQLFADAHTQKYHSGSMSESRSLFLVFWSTLAGPRSW